MTLFHRKPKIDRRMLCRVIAYLEAAPYVEYDPYHPIPDGIECVLGLLEPDYEYLVHHDEIEEQGIEPAAMSLENIRTMLTFFSRGERFCDGFTVSIVNDGSLLAVLKRLEELTR